MLEIFQKRTDVVLVWPGWDFSRWPGSLDGSRRQVQARALLGEGLAPQFTFTVWLSCHCRDRVGVLCPQRPVQDLAHSWDLINASLFGLICQ